MLPICWWGMSHALEDIMDLKDLLNSDNTLLFSSPKYLNRFASDEQVLEFLRRFVREA